MMLTSDYLRRVMSELSRNELILMRGALYTKRMYRGMKHIPHGVIIWEDWMEDTLEWLIERYEINIPIYLIGNNDK